MQVELDLQRAQLFFESAPDAIVIVNEVGDIEVGNRQMVDLLGYSHDELVGMSVDLLLPQRFRSGHVALRTGFTKNPQFRGMGSELDLLALTKDGREIPIEVSLSPIKTESGNLVSAAIRDISERKAVQHALQDSQKKLQLAKELAESATEAKTRFLAAASHDIRQPLQALRLYLSALASKLEEEKAKQLAAKMHTSLDTMGEILDALLDVSTLESGSVEPTMRDVALAEVLDRIVIDNTQQAEEKGLRLECDAIDYTIYSDPALLQRIIENFVTNALRYTEQGKVSIECALLGEKLRIAVKDTGAGIPQDECDKIFDEFYQLDNAVRDRRKGLGLGLSIVKHIARILEHEINVVSEIGQGSIFSVDVPLGKAASRAKEVDPIVGLSIDDAQEPTVLIIDDDLTIVDSMVELISVFDCQVMTAENGPEAIKHIENGLKPDLIITDYRMPGMTGVETVINIRAMLSEDLPVVIMTGDTSAQKIKDANLQHCTVMHKPVNVDQLMSLLEIIKK